MSDSSWKDKGAGGLGCLMAIAFMGYGIVVLALGWIGIEDEFGYWWGITAVALALIFRFTLPITIGAIFGAMHVWGWHWILATLFALPGLVFMIPAVIGMIIGAFSNNK